MQRQQYMSRFFFLLRTLRLVGLTTLGVGLVGLFSGCGSSSFLGQQIEDFRAYYNTFYNARRSFDEGRRALERRQAEPIDGTTYISLFGPPARPGNVTPFNKAIDKSANVLREHPRSKWADDALMVIGQSYYYMGNYAGAAQKFREVMALSRDYELEARLWLARALLAARSYEELQTVLQETLAREGLASGWQARFKLLEAELYVQQRRWEAARQALEGGLEHVPDRELGARGYFLLGQVCETLRDYSCAYRAFDRVRRYRPDYELGYAAAWHALRMQGLHLDASAALRGLNQMLRDDKHFARQGELYYLRARVYQAMGEAETARALYEELLYGNLADASRVRGRIHYALGELYRDAFRDYERAAAYFDTAAAAFRPAAQPTRAGAETILTPFALSDVAELARVFGQFRRVRQEIHRLDSLLYLGSLDDEAFAAFVLELRRRRAQELEAQRRAAGQRALEQRFLQGQPTPSMLGQEVGEAATAVGEAGFLFHRDPIRLQENRSRFFERWGRRPLAPNWRRLAALRSATAPTVAAAQQTAEEAGEAELDVALPFVDVSDVPRDSVRRAQLLAERAQLRYELGNVLFLSMQRPDSAAYWYRLIILEDADQPVAQRAYYALAEVHRALGDTLAAQALLATLLQRYPTTPLASQLRAQLGQASTTTSNVPDTLTLAEAAYARAVAAWQAGQHQEALQRLLEVAVHYENTPVAPRALWATAYVWQDLLGGIALSDSSRFPIPVPIEFAARLPASSTDSVQAVAGDTATATFDSLRPTLTQLYTYLAEHYPQSREAQRAQQVLAALRPSPPSPAVSPADTAQIASPRAPRDRLQEARLSQEEPQPVREVWTILLLETDDANQVGQMLQQYRSLSSGAVIDVRPFQHEGRMHYRLILGRYPNAQAAQAALEQLHPVLQAAARPFRLEPPESRN
jgi:cellulose synthase operon protein C